MGGGVAKAEGGEPGGNAHYCAQFEHKQTLYEIGS